ncbi:Asp-tRNA(Asn)/Glu-tRNA(Gln) amidotransferase subunit GatB [Candidatus Wolfebacteria bacterium]|nr:Asp-tRNA(Asn)/Glu-tRNA(Gln) amidotransferase subunit GatB [Candidatus Wolfebacteria bacterium]
MRYVPTIGLEIHSQLKTATKMFCGCPVIRSNEQRIESNSKRMSDSNSSSFGDHLGAPNTAVCPVCLAHPGALPVPNKEAIEAVIRLGIAINGTIATISKFDRKNYFYPDLPKGYQISQYDQPFVKGGELCGVRITRVHLEEDTGRIQHLGPASGAGQSASLIDFNRAGIPLMELVTEPDIKSGEQAVRFAKELQLILRYLGASDADMEKGQMRVEVNISLAPVNTDGTRTDTEESPYESVSSPHKSVPMGTKVEIKNLNSFRAVGEAVEYEIKRQSEILDHGDKITQETRGWDDVKKITKSQRLKESSHDYRYFPEPDIPPLDLAKFDLERLRVSVPELPKEKRVRFKKEYDLASDQVEILTGDPALADYFERAASELKAQLPTTNYQLLVNYLTTDLLGSLNRTGSRINDAKVMPEHLAHLTALISQGELSSRMAKDILGEMLETGLDPEEIVKTKGMVQISDEESLKKAIEEVIAENPEAVADYKKGKGNAAQFLVGQTMARLKGKGNPQAINRLVGEVLTNK